MAIPSLAMIPSGYKDGKVYSVLPSNGDGDFTFSRGSNATRVNKDGFIETVTGDTPRLDYSDSSCPSLLLEPQRTNLVTYSKDFSNAAWTKQEINITANAAIAPDGTTTADKVIPTAVATTHQVVSNAVISSTQCAFGVFAKADGYNTIEILDRQIAANGAVFNLSTGSFTIIGTATATIENYGNGWYRCTVVANTTGVRYYIPTSQGNFLGDGISGVYLWGASLEAGSYPTSYIPTNGATATRLADVCNDAGTSDTFNDSEGVLMAEIKSENNDVSVRQLSVSEGISDEVVKILFLDDNTVRFEMKTVIGTNFSKDLDLDIYSFNKFALKYKSNDYSVFVNGIKYSVSQTTSTPIGLNTLNFNSGNGGTPFYGNTKQIQYYNSALTDSELEELTSWESFLDMANGQNYTIK